MSIMLSVLITSCDKVIMMTIIVLFFCSFICEPHRGPSPALPIQTNTRASKNTVRYNVYVFFMIWVFLSPRIKDWRNERKTL